jgi:putative copper export protein
MGIMVFSLKYIGQLTINIPVCVISSIFTKNHGQLLVLRLLLLLLGLWFGHDNNRLIGRFL